MPKKKKHPRLPNSFGSIRFLGKSRRNPYAVHPPCTEISDAGDYIRPKALCYVRDWYVGFSVLMSYHAGTYQPGDEEEFQRQRERSSTELDGFCARILKDYQIHAQIEITLAQNEKTFEDVYKEYYDWKYGDKAQKKLSAASRQSTSAAYKHCTALYNRTFQRLTIQELQDAVNSCTCGQATVENIVMLIRQMYAFAEPRDYCKKNLGKYVIVPDMDGDEHGVPFSDTDIRRIWELRADPVAEMLIIMCYTGMRIAEYKSAHVDMDEWFLQGGLKTRAGKNRIIPIHPSVQPLVSARIQRDAGLLTTTPATFRDAMYAFLDRAGIERHTPHDCRHTFSALCERYKVSEADRKRLLGHSLRGDVTNDIYGHRTLSDLRAEIQKLPPPDAF